MPHTCNWDGCDSATICRGAREADGNVVVEKYTCSVGHEFHETIEL